MVGNCRTRRRHTNVWEKFSLPGPTTLHSFSSCSPALQLDGYRAFSFLQPLRSCMGCRKVLRTRRQTLQSGVITTEITWHDNKPSREGMNRCMPLLTPPHGSVSHVHRNSSFKRPAICSANIANFSSEPESNKARIIFFCTQAQTLWKRHSLLGCWLLKKDKKEGSPNDWWNCQSFSIFFASSLLPLRPSSLKAASFIQSSPNTFSKRMDCNLSSMNSIGDSSFFPRQWTKGISTWWLSDSTPQMRKSQNRRPTSMKFQLCRMRNRSDNDGIPSHV